MQGQGQLKSKKCNLQRAGALVAAPTQLAAVAEAGREQCSLLGAPLLQCSLPTLPRPQPAMPLGMPTTPLSADSGAAIS